MPRISSAIDRANAILRAHGTPFRLREGHGSRWLSVYENCPGRRVRERSARGYAGRMTGMPSGSVAACSNTPRTVLIKGSTTSSPGFSPRPAAGAQPPAHPAGPRSAKPWWPSNGARG